MENENNNFGADSGMQQTYGADPNSNGAGQTYGADQNSYGAGQTYGQNQNAYGTNQTYGQNQNTYGTGQTYSTGQTYGTDQNSYGAGQTYGQNQNTYGTNQTYGQNYSQNAYGAGQTYGQQNYGQQNYGYGANNYGMGGGAPIGNNGKPLENRFGMKITFSVLEMILLLTCNLGSFICGLIGCIFTAKANTSYKENRWEDFKSQAKGSAIALWIGFAFFVIELLSIIIAAIIGVKITDIVMDEFADPEYTVNDYYDYDYDYDSETESEENEDSESEETESEDSESEETNVGLGHELYGGGFDVFAKVDGAGFIDPTISINGVSVTLPISYADFKELGFYMDTFDEEWTLGSKEYTYSTFYDANDVEIGTLYVVNLTDEEEVASSEGIVFGFNIYADSDYDGEIDADIDVSGLSFESTREDVYSALGSPDDVYESDASEDYLAQYLTWYNHNDLYYDDYQNSLEIDFWNGEMDSIYIRYIGWD